MEHSKAPPPPMNPMAAMFGDVAKQAQAAAQEASLARHKELLLLLTEIRDLLKLSLGE